MCTIQQRSAVRELIIMQRSTRSPETGLPVSQQLQSVNKGSFEATLRTVAFASSTGPHLSGPLMTAIDPAVEYKFSVDLD